MRNALIALLLSVSAAQATPATRADKAVILDWARSFFADPQSLRGTGISEVTSLTIGGRAKATICVELNAKNQASGYTGIDRVAFIVTPGGLVYGDWRQGVTTATCWEPQVVMKPFPELSAIK